ncbi:hypothetical protein B0T18DRAFT_211371 [Schizothecium vesticola]|uniref:Uncharacterized protein n=1 Tax=Schizothecium vesticola TaxID=314040 RepID=A0AA40JZ79_9PEZI|nr:hypothetical protein B0T18DRAFT_211371 [Schizothecium vesticola]
MQPTPSSKKLAKQRKGLQRANSRRPHTRPSEVHAGCCDDSPIVLCLIAPMRLYSRRSDRTVIGRGGSRCSAHEDDSEGGPRIHIEIHDVAEAFSKRGSRSKWFKARHRENPEDGGGAVRPQHPHQSPGQAEEGCQPGLSELGSSVPSQQPALTHGSCGPSLMRLLLRYRLPSLGSEGGEGSGFRGPRPGSGTSSKSKGVSEATKSGRGVAEAGSGVVLSLGGIHGRAA